MSYPYGFHSDILRQNWGFILAWGILLLILGILALCFSFLTTLISVITVGILILIGGIIFIIDAFKSWWGKWGAFILHIIIGILYCAVGIMLIQNPIMGSVSLTLLIGIFYIVLGVFRLINSLTYRLTKWGFSFVNGLLSLLLGILILINWPMAGLFIIGLFVGIDLIFTGWTYIMIASSASKL